MNSYSNIVIFIRMKFYFLFHLMLPSPNTKSQGAKNDSVFGKMKEFVGSLIFFNYFWAS